MKSNGFSAKTLLTKIVVTALLLVQGYAQAECHFGARGEGGSSTIVNTIASSPVYFSPVPQGQFPSDGYEIGGPYNASLSPALWSECDSGNEGDQMSNITYGSIGGVAGNMWPTNVTGIYYAVRIYSDNNPGSYFQTNMDGQWQDLPAHAGVKSHDWKVQIKLIQISDYHGNPTGITMITPKEAKRIGGMSIGGHTDSDNQPWWFDVTPATFSIPIAAATCQTAVVNNGTNNVDFGEIMFSTMKTGYYPNQIFNLQLRGCNNVVAINYRVSSTKVAGNAPGQLLINTLSGSNAAAGIGVSIAQEFPADRSGHGEPFINDPNYIYVPLPQVGSNASNDLPFQASLTKDGAELKPGNFVALATFTIDYL
ncbi:fimbrial protein [Enterobacter bugandensis]|uniref:fimbrial protein n=1 Tax=Enterobacter bugandensis TaxID=881260 RepID=UPI001C99B5D2|nr:fimbrial protein [Enterobacter bugandensis]MBY6291180.1 fimbrial protein [Enterobacter bugandensis]